MYQNKIAIVTGGASGIGKEICKYLAKRGASVIIADIDQKAANTVARELGKTNANVQAKLVDVSKREEVKKLITDTHAEFGRIDLMINNAGIGLDGEFKDMTLEHWEHVLDVNLWGVIYGTYYVYPIMIRQGFGQIVNVSSIAGLMPGGLMTSYVASKSAVTGFTLSLRAEAYQYGIKVNALCPGFIETPLHDRTLKVSDYLNLEKNQRDKTRFPEAKDSIKSMMRGIEKDRAIIVVPKTQKLYWWAYRLFPGLIPYFWRRMIKKMKG
jgi:NAD(P)-dependent dehydrogenase (short-subunit alcohol dehydrogenase family)